MEFYYFGGNFNPGFVEQLEEHHFSGILFTYDATQGDFFTKVARDIDIRKNIKYMIAIRPHVISPQYLCMVARGMNDIMKDRLQINLISGHVKEHERDFGGVLGTVVDLSSRKERSEYLIKYIECLNEMKKNPKVTIPDYYISTTNKYVFKTATSFNDKIIMGYRDFQKGYWTEINENGNEYPGEKFDFPKENVMIAFGPILRKTKEQLDLMDRQNISLDSVFLTYDEFDKLIKDLESMNVKEVLIHGWPAPERDIIIDYIKKYKEERISEGW